MTIANNIRIPLLFILTGVTVGYITSMDIKIGLSLIVALIITAIAFFLGMKKFLLLGIIFSIIIPPTNFLPTILNIGVINPLTGIIFLAVAVSFLIKLKDFNNLKTSVPHLLIFIIFIAMMFLSVYNAYFQDASIYKIIRFTSTSFLVYLAVGYLVDDRKKVDFVISAFVAMVSLVSIYAIFEYFSRHNFIFQDLLHIRTNTLRQYWVIYRASGTTGLPNVLACLIVVTIPLILYKLKVSTKKIMYSFFLIINLWAMYCTMSRAAIAVMVITMLIQIVSKRNKYKSFMQLGFISILICTVSFFVITDVGLMDKLSLRWNFDNLIQSGSYWHRMYKFESALLILGDRPLFGVGFGNYPLISSNLKYLSIGDPNALNTFDNMYLMIISEMGICGFLSFLLLIGAVIHTLIKGIKLADSETKKLLGAILLSTVAFLIYSIILETYMWNSLNITFWLLVAVGVKIVKLHSQPIVNNVAIEPKLLGRDTSNESAIRS